MADPSANGWARDAYELAEPATESDFAAVLENVSLLPIRGEYVTGLDTGDLDSVRLTPP